MAQWEIVIGLETHVQLTTASKIFCGCSTAFGAAPNTQVGVVGLAMPGALPVMNRGAVERAVKFGLAIGAKINQRSIMARKNYFYPDLPKGYQISQFETPIVQGGGLTITLDDGATKFIELTRAHLEEDAGKSVHDLFDGQSGVDLNRAGTPLLEIVTEPVMRSAKEAIAYARTLHNLVRYLDICDGNMQEGSFRCDVNVSVRPIGQQEFGTRREIKNLNSFKFMQQAIDYEVRWQIEQIEDGKKIVQATVLFNPDTGETRAMRTKEDAMDYRYFPDPDLPPLVVSDEDLARIKAALPELPAAKCDRFIREYGLSKYDATLLSQDGATASFFETAVKAGADAKLVANWMLGEVAAALNREEKTIEQSPVNAVRLSNLVARISDGTISHKIAKTVFEALWSGDGASVDAIIDAKGLRQISDSGAIEKIVDEVLAKSAAQIADFKAGKEKALMSIVGMVMKASQGKANPAQVNEIVRKKLGSGI
ncbi:MAG TPA: Asp-tRNA(Asn)/Glu-tRNA(Gln) amidotransferase subunit GatB [Casimicrobium huifangae]|jgi:aspartyl-tRNA(Asn)/glutamyl-tRNA(Gln) amidotransferase subunit B|uniref:Asp-tRNA(Asn)/Glu-tRNA(Gln) amidotransferase subunit GatB n=1 Tax=Casimicrobium huifangae TaxID=2591109 RepID=UPI001EE3157E|nr:Asp-tRNA(Asn)/Glu-tRNA(Gln) amidotransferase subunit GatB [Casimicrobium huifangae]HOB01658.1 Asp-tRNA(Asn)/Glu-tRNA(Gln) amidotransferase subunit GatB [Casimicrobium huifangae]HQA32313.1 Asp-tRNA(Asn)/Glu-tRNA(Gln) amidotransferase subunit GatB [Casimicrobium huifangae]HQD64082.1 Asp-tRNA(Asn)/Glu-tRNA(Gln) amidotransferase subunit GatB [Casimicrobium huifangae]